MTAQKEPDFSAFTKLDEPDCCDDLEEISVPEAEVVSETVPSAKKQSVNRQELSKAAPATAENSSAPKKQPRSSQQEIEDGIASVEAEAAESAKAVRPEYVYPPPDRSKAAADAGQLWRACNGYKRKLRSKCYAL